MAPPASWSSSESYNDTQRRRYSTSSASASESPDILTPDSMSDAPLSHKSAQVLSLELRNHLARAEEVNQALLVALHREQPPSQGEEEEDHARSMPQSSTQELSWHPPIGMWIAGDKCPRATAPMTCLTCDKYGRFKTGLEQNRKSLGQPVDDSIAGAGRTLPRVLSSTQLMLSTVFAMMKTLLTLKWNVIISSTWTTLSTTVLKILDIVFMRQNLQALKGDADRACAAILLLVVRASIMIRGTCGLFPDGSLGRMLFCLGVLRFCWVMTEREWRCA